MSGSGLEEKVENMNLDERKAVEKKGCKHGQKTKKKDEQSVFPLEVHVIQKMLLPSRAFPCAGMIYDDFLSRCI